jgi:uncharacterized membrane protein YdbT with pleckstrin-like domain
MEEKIIWEGGPSQVINLGTYVVCALTCVLIVPIFIALWVWIETRCKKFSLTDQRLRYSCGVFNRVTDELELYRVKDLLLEEPFKLRVFGLGNVILKTSDRTTPELTIPAIKEAPVVRDTIRQYVEQRRDKKGVREVDFE